MLTITETPAKLIHLSCRTEKHGEKSIGANDLKLEVHQPNGVLAEFDPILLPLMFQTDAKNGDQHNLDLGASGERFTHVRPTHLSAPKSEREFPGYKATIATPGGFSPPIELFDCKLSNFGFEGVEGGAVKITFRLSCAPSDEDVGKLRGMMVDGDVVLTLVPPSAEVAQGDVATESDEDRQTRENLAFADAAAQAIAKHSSKPAKRGTAH